MLRDTLIKLNNDNEVELDFEYNDEIVTKIDCSKIEFNKVIFNNCIFNNVVIDEGLFYNVTFNNCDLSNIKLYNCYFKDCKFNQSKLSGSQFSGSQFKNVKFSKNQMNYAFFNEVKMEQVIIEECNLEEACLVDMKFKKKIEFINTILSNCSLVNSLFSGIDLSSCKIDGLILSDDFREIRGCKLRHHQLLDLVHLFKIELV